MSIVLVGSTSGSVTLQEPAVAGTTVLTLPAVSGTVLTTGSSGQSIPRAALPTGSVLQVASATDSTTAVVSSTSLVSISGLSLSITPTSSSSKILLWLSGGDFITNAPGKNLYTTFYRDSTNLATGVDFLSRYNGVASELFLPHSMMIYDSPATTSSITYSVYAKISGNSVYFSSQTAVTMIAMEISA